jgi:hypothetical protein
MGKGTVYISILVVSLMIIGVSQYAVYNVDDTTKKTQQFLNILSMLLFFAVIISTTMLVTSMRYINTF